MSHSLIYITAPNRDDALKLAHILVESRLLACANILDGVTSVYRWEGKINQDPETVLIGKTRSALVDAVIAKVRACHPYSCPCVVAMPIAAGNPAFLDWISTET
ncbi:Divalent-cation tolerance protein CutA [Candidatus Terasakiella magnetica]|nr:Divalent-cation tolerance protein CutA [Candidatus Terasakiella magnetica]